MEVLRVLALGSEKEEGDDPAGEQKCETQLNAGSSNMIICISKQIWLDCPIK